MKTRMSSITISSQYFNDDVTYGSNEKQKSIKGILLGKIENKISFMDNWNCI